MEKVHSISELPNFPYKTVEAFRAAHNSKEIRLGTNQGLARQLAMQSIYSPFWLRSTTYLFTYSPYIISISLSIYFILTNNWLWLFSVPLPFLALDILIPGSAIRYRGFQPVFKWLIVLSFLFSLLLFNLEFFVISCALLLQWISIIFGYTNADYFVHAVCINNENLIIDLWQKSALAIYNNNGECLMRNFKEVNGKIINYDVLSNNNLSYF